MSTPCSTATPRVPSDCLRALPEMPDLAIVAPRKQSRWLQEMTMGVLRAPPHGLLTQADVHDRYRLMSPSVPELETGCVNVHSTLRVVDDELRLFGSANLNNRSMVLDTEGNIAIDANGDPRIMLGALIGMGPGSCRRSHLRINWLLRCVIRRRVPSRF